MNLSLLICSLRASPRGEDMSKIKRAVPFGLGTALIGEQWKGVKGGFVNGPTTWPLSNSFCIAKETLGLFLLADALFFPDPGPTCPSIPISKPNVNPCIT